MNVYYFVCKKNIKKIKYSQFKITYKNLKNI